MKTILLLILTSFALPSYSQTWDELIYQGKKERANGNFKKAGELIAKGADLKGNGNFEHYYYAAIMFANANEPDSSFKLLEKCIDAGMYDWARWERNGRLKKLHEDKRWDKLKIRMKEAEEKFTANLSHPELRDELKLMWKKDQDLLADGMNKKLLLTKIRFG